MAPKFFRHSVLELFYIPMWNILKMWATYSKALLENHMIFHLCVVAFHQFLVSSRECARTSKVAALLPLLHCCVITEQKVTRKTWEEATPDVSGLFSCCFYSFSRSENLKIMAVFNWNYLSFVNFDSTWVYREMVLIPILIVILWFVWMKVVR